MPEEFVPVAEETGIIQEIDDWVLRQACIQSRAWLDAGLPLIHVAVNLSGSQFHRKDLLERVDDALDVVERRLPPGFPDQVWSRIAEGMRRHAAQFLRAAA